MACVPSAQNFTFGDVMLFPVHAASSLAPMVQANDCVILRAKQVTAGLLT